MLSGELKVRAERLQREQKKRAEEVQHRQQRERAVQERLRAQREAHEEELRQRRLAEEATAEAVCLCLLLAALLLSLPMLPAPPKGSSHACSYTALNLLCSTPTSPDLRLTYSVSCPNKCTMLALRWMLVWVTPAWALTMLTRHNPLLAHQERLKHEELVEANNGVWWSAQLHAVPLAEDAARQKGIKRGADKAGPASAVAVSCMQDTLPGTPSVGTQSKGAEM